MAIGNNDRVCPNAKVRRLDNGLTVTSERLPHLRSAAVGVWVRTGSANETAEQAGICHFIEHLLFKGTETRSARDLVEAIESQGGQLNAFTSRDYTCVYAKTLDVHVETAIDVLADLIKHSRFPDLEKERSVVLEEIASIEDVPEDAVHERLALRVWPNHALGRPVSGTLETVSALTLDDLREYYHRWYQPQHLCVSIAGNFDEESVTAQIDRLFGSMAAGSPEDPPPPAPSFGHGTERVARDIGQSHLCLGFPGPATADPKRYGYDVLTNALGGGSTSRLFEQIREEAGLAYSIYAFHSAHLTSGMVGIYAAVAPRNANETLDLICRELRRFRDEPLSQAELDMNREQLKGGMLMALENTFVRMSRMAKSMFYYDRLVSVEEVVQAVDAVTPESLQALAQEAFSKNTCAFVTLGPPNGDVPAGVSL